MILAYLTFALANLVALASPGPAFIALSQTALDKDRGAALAMGVGLAFFATLWCGLALFGLTVVFEFVPWLYTTLKIVGGLYLIYLATKIWRGATQSQAQSPNLRQNRNAFFMGCAINATNPKSALFAGSVLLAIFPMELMLSQKLIILAITFGLETLFYSSLALTLSQPPIRQRYSAAKHWLDRCAATVLGALGLGILMSRNGG